MEIEIIVKPKSEMPYATMDNYYWTDHGKLVLEIADTGNVIYNRLLLIHSIVEQLLTDVRGVSSKMITKFDLEFDVKHPNTTDEPGEDPNAPYKNEHLAAKAIEMLLCAYMNIPWKEYNDCLG